MVQVPAATVVTVGPDPVHTMGESERNDTARDGFASVEPDKVTGWPRMTSGGWAKVIVCWLVPVCAWNERCTAWAAA